MHIIWKNHAHTNENLRTSFSAPTSFLIGCGRMMIFWGTRNKKAARFFFASFLFLVGAACFFCEARFTFEFRHRHRDINLAILANE